MSLPFLLDYLPEAAPFLKVAEEPRRKPSNERIPLNKATILAGLQGAAAIAVGTGIGYGTGKLVGYGADALAKKLTGQPFPTKYLPQAFAVMGALGTAAEAKQLKHYKELLRNAYENSQNRAPRGAARK